MVRLHAWLKLAARQKRLKRSTIDKQKPRLDVTVLGIETSADDTCVALMSIRQTQKGHHTASMLSNDKVTYQNQKHKGIHPVEAVVSHTQNLSRMVSAAMATQKRRKPDLICVTRGPGMGGCLSVGVTTAKALSAVWDIPIVGVHHMQAHALTHAMETALNSQQLVDFAYPFLTLLVSGKHTMLVHTKSAVDHRILASSDSTALGDVLDKVARELVHASWIKNQNDAICYPNVMEQRAGSLFTGYAAPQTRREELEIYESAHGWRLLPPLRDTKAMKYNFTGLCGQALVILRERPEMLKPERRELATHFMRLCFQHLMSRVIIALETDEDLLRTPPQALVLSGGVASNSFLRTVVTETLKARGFDNIKLAVPSRHNCTDNAGMIAYAGYTMYERGWQTDKSFCPATQWSIEEILSGVDCWTRSPGAPPIASEDAESASLGSNRADIEAASVDALESPRNQPPPHSEQLEAPTGATMSPPSDPHTSHSETIVDETNESPGEEVGAICPPAHTSEGTAIDEPLQTTVRAMDEADLQLERILRQAESILGEWEISSATQHTSTSSNVQTAVQCENFHTQADHGKDPKESVATLPSARIDEPSSSRKSSSARAQGAGDKVDSKSSGQQLASRQQTQNQEQQSAEINGDEASYRKSSSARDQAPPHAADATEPKAAAEPKATVKKPAAQDAKQHDTVTKNARTSDPVQPASVRAASPARFPPRLPPQAIAQADARRDVPAKFQKTNAPKPMISAKVTSKKSVKKSAKSMSHVWPATPSEKERHDLKVHYLGFEDEPAPQRASWFTGRIASVFGLGRK